MNGIRYQNINKGRLYKLKKDLYGEYQQAEYYYLKYIYSILNWTNNEKWYWQQQW